MTNRLKELVEAVLTSRDLTLAWLTRRLFPLREREHKMCFYSGPRDPTRVSAKALELKTMRAWAAGVIADQVEEDWEFGLDPFTRASRAPVVSLFHCFSLS